MLEKRNAEEARSAPTRFKLEATAASPELKYKKVWPKASVISVSFLKNLADARWSPTVFK